MVPEPQIDGLPPDPRGPSVLLVEDERSIAEPFASALTRSGFRTSVARTGAEAMRLAGSSIRMSSCSIWRSRTPTGVTCAGGSAESDVPIIMVTASGTVTDRVVGLELGADDYVVKPFATGEVIARIRAVLRRRPASPVDGQELEIQELRIDLGARRVWVRGA